MPDSPALRCRTCLCLCLQLASTPHLLPPRTLGRYAGFELRIHKRLIDLHAAAGERRWGLRPAVPAAGRARHSSPPRPHPRAFPPAEVVKQITSISIEPGVEVEVTIADI